MVFHALSFDPDFEDSWSLDVQHLHDDGSWKDVWAFTRCERIANIPFEIIVEEHGRAPDFDVTGAFAVPVVSEKWPISSKGFAQSTSNCLLFRSLSTGKPIRIECAKSNRRD